MPKRTKSKRKPKQGSSLEKYVSRFDSNHPEHFLTYSISGVGIGVNSAGGSLAFNSQLINNALIQLGTGRDKRVGQHIVLTRMRLRLYVTMSMATRVRCMIFANPRDALLESQTSNANLTALIEATPFLMQAQHGTAALGPVDWLVDPSCDYTVLHDQMYGCGAYGGLMPSQAGAQTIGAGIQYGGVLVPIEIDLPFILPQMYNNSGVPQTGDWCVYLASTSTNVAGTPQCVAYGSIMLQYVDALSLEAIGSSIRDFVDTAGNTIEYIGKSKFYQQIKSAVPFATRAWGMLG